MKKNEFIKLFMMVLGLNILVTGSSSVALAKDTIGESGLWDYDHHWTPEWSEWRAKNRLGRGYKKDPHIWVYTSEFAERFGMPDRWIDDSLEGAVALAFRYDYDLYGVGCGYSKGVESCSPKTACILDVYVSEEADLPWNTESMHESAYGLKSVEFLRGQVMEDLPEYLNRRAKRGQRSWPRGLDDITIQYRDGGSLGKYSIWEYERELYKGIDYLSGSVSCGFDNQENQKGVMFQVANPTFYPSGNVDPLLKLGSKDEVALQFEIPASFLKRVSERGSETGQKDNVLKQVRDSLATKRVLNAEQMGVK